MIIYLRNEKNKTLLDVELFIKKDYVELHSSVILDEYSNKLIKLHDNLEDYQQFITDFNELSELRGWLCEVYQDTEKENYNDIKKQLLEIISTIAVKWNLIVVTD